MIEIRLANAEDLQKVQAHMAESHGGDVESVRRIMMQNGSMVIAYYEKDIVYAIMGITKSDKFGVCGLCTLYTTHMLKLPMTVVKMGRRTIANLFETSNITGLEYAIPNDSITGDRFSRLMGFTKISESDNLDIYYRGA